MEGFFSALLSRAGILCFWRCYLEGVAEGEEHLMALVANVSG